MRVEPTTAPAPKSMKQRIEEMGIGDGLIFFETTQNSVRTTIQRIRGTHPKRRFTTMVGDDGGVLIWRRDDNPGGKAVAD